MLGGDYYYNGNIKKIIALMGALFKNIYVQRKDINGNVINQEKVPIRYAPGHKFIDRNKQEPGNLEEGEVRFATQYPRISYEMTNMIYDGSRQTNQFCSKRISSPSGDGNKKGILSNPVPYTFSFQVYIYSKNLDEAYQIVEQIAPQFRPSLGLTIRPIDGNTEVTDDVLITLLSLSPNDTYEGSAIQRREIIFSLDFEVKASLYSRILDTGVIKQVIVNFRDNLSNDEIFDITHTVNPFDAEENEVYTIDTSYTGIE